MNERLEDMEKKELVELVKQAVAENERLLRACHAQRDRAIAAEQEMRLVKELQKTNNQVRWCGCGIPREDGS